MRIARRASLAYFHLRRFAGRYRRKRRHSAALDDLVLMFSRDRPARSTGFHPVLLSVVEILHLLGNNNTRLTALADNMLRFVIGIYSDELNYLHEKKNNRQPF